MAITEPAERYLATLPAKLEEATRRALADAPPFTDQQKRIIRAAFSLPDARPSEPTEREQREARERQERAERERAIREMSRALLDCGICGVPREGHHKSFTQQHDFVPLNDDQIRKVLG